MLFAKHLALLASAAFAANNTNTTTNTNSTMSQKYIKLDFSVIHGYSNATSKAYRSKIYRNRIVKRDDSNDLHLDDENLMYAAKLKIGSPGQDNYVSIDTGSSDLWVVSNNVECLTVIEKRAFHETFGLLGRRLSDLERRDSRAAEMRQKREKSSSSISTSTTIGGSCTAGGSFNTKGSSSFATNKSVPQFYISYGDESFAMGIWGKDYINFGGANISNCNFAVAHNTSSYNGVFGVGLQGNEASNVTTDLGAPFVYENIPMRMKSSGAINKNLYSLYLNDSSKKTGSLLFGAIDHSKYSGQLQTVPIINTQPERGPKPLQFDVVLSSMSFESTTQNVSLFNSPVAMLLDSGTSLSFLPEPLFHTMGRMMNGTFHPSGTYKVSCGYKTSSFSAIFNFSGIKIKVPLSDLVSTKDSKCYLGVSGISYDSTAPWGVLGDNFLRNAYVVYDLDDYEISLAQVNAGGKENIEVVSKAIPRASKASGYSATKLATSLSTSSPKSHLSIPPVKTSSGSRGFRLVDSVLLGIACAYLVFVF